MIKKITYSRGFREDPNDFKGLKTIAWTAPEIPKPILDSLDKENILGLPEILGKPDAVSPAQIERVEMVTEEKTLSRTVYNREAPLFHSDAEWLDRISRFFQVMREEEEIRKILKGLEGKSGKSTQRALKKAIKLREKITPHLLKLIEDSTAKGEALMDEVEGLAPSLAMYLLAQFREKAAYPVIVKFFSILGDVAVEFSGDIVTEDLSSILASVCHNDLRLIKGLIEDPNMNEWVSEAAIGSLAILAAHGEIPRDDVMAYYKELLRGKVDKDSPMFWSGLVCSSLDLGPEEVYQDIVKAFENDLVEPGHVCMEDVEKSLSMGKDQCLQIFKDCRRGFIDDAIRATGWWACFEEDDKRDWEKPEKWEEDFEEDDYMEQTYVRAEPKTGRNDPCPCNSGKKYKKCCGR